MATGIRTGNLRAVLSKLDTVRNILRKMHRLEEANATKHIADAD